MTTEITWGYLKSSEKKIWTTTCNGALSVTGAGDSEYAETISQQLHEAFSKDKDLPVDKLEIVFANLVGKFHKEHVIPFARFSDSPSLWLVIAAERAGERRLWATSRSALRRCSSFICAGVGREYATPLITSVLDAISDRSRFNTDMVEKLAVYAVYASKERVQTVGKGTQLVTIKNNGALDMDHGTTSLLEYYLSDYFELQALGLQYIFGYPFINDASALRNLSNYFKSLQSTLQQLSGVRTASSRWRLE